MIVDKDGNYSCSLCGKKYPRPQEADTCRDSHGVIYVPLTPTELNHIVNFIFTQEEELISEDLIKKLQKYARAKVV